MLKWNQTVRIRHLLLDHEEERTNESVTRSMNNIGRVLEKHSCFNGFWLINDFQDEFDADCEDADYLLDSMYDYADLHRIWIE